MSVVTGTDSLVELYRPLGAAEYCGITTSTLNRWRRDGLIDPAEIIGIGSGYLYTEPALLGALQATNYDRKNLGVEVLGNGE